MFEKMKIIFPGDFKGRINYFVSIYMNITTHGFKSFSKTNSTDARQRFL